MSTIETDRCYVVYGTGFNPMKIRGSKPRKGLMTRIKKRGFKPKYSLVSAKKGTCKKKPILYNSIPGCVTIR